MRSSRRKRKTQNVSDPDFEINCSSDDNGERGTIMLFQSYSLTTWTYENMSKRVSY